MVRYNTQRGFSVFEVIVALQFLVIVSLLATPKMSGIFAQYQLTSASSQLGFELIRARMQAVGQNRYVRIRTLSGSQYVRESSADGTTWSNQTTMNLPSGANATSAEVRFDKRGFATINNAITVDTGIAQTKTVTTNAVGVVTVA